ncbi:hypothetical protein EXIGLDRAFT_105706 [Exidia glandulosa HHB12029]|uniref:Uncharacterized protein n=1 Tax=Exidia glandulosa HHB12029 TaxID=1314781 RepID=A0A165GU23_EXIGL|nr:hypothetical protein EXIGLDRAFT_105706 [Exidia glandulosa HHB12029]
MQPTSSRQRPSPDATAAVAARRQRAEIRLSRTSRSPRPALRAPGCPCQRPGSLRRARIRRTFPARSRGSARPASRRRFLCPRVLRARVRHQRPTRRLQRQRLPLDPHRRAWESCQPSLLLSLAPNQPRSSAMTTKFHFPARRVQLVGVAL